MAEAGGGPVQGTDGNQGPKEGREKGEKGQGEGAEAEGEGPPEDCNCQEAAQLEEQVHLLTYGKIFKMEIRKITRLGVVEILEIIV